MKLREGRSVSMLEYEVMRRKKCEHVRDNKVGGKKKGTGNSEIIKLREG